MKNPKITGYVTHAQGDRTHRVSFRMYCARKSWTTLFMVTGVCWPGGAGAHAWNIPYYLPVPLWLYAYASAGTLILSFAILSLASGQSFSLRASRVEGPHREWRIPIAIFSAIQVVCSLFLVFLAISGIAGAQNPFQNIGMTGFWIWFYLGYLYLSAVLGDFYAFVNPFEMVLRIVARYCPSIDTGWFRYPLRVAYYPALIGYVVLIALELFGSGTPSDVSLFLGAYLAYALIGSLCFGRAVWSEYFDTLGMLCRLCAMLSALAWTTRSDRTVGIRFRRPLAEIASGATRPASVVVFLSFMLSSTAFDGLRDTAPWSAFFWRHIYTHIVDHWPALAKDYALSANLFLGWQWTMFVVTGAVYYLVFMGFCWLSAAVSRTSLDGASLARQFCLALLPIAFFYNVCHYFTLFLNQGRQVLLLASDPLGRGWHLFQVPPAAYPGTQPPVNMSLVWHAQVFFILLGHLLSVYIAHAIALRNRDLARTVMINQLPLLVLTIGLTISGLWILSLPLA
ncbi:hypothetical protein PQQ99_30775 [Paraburkholderia sediminicola]|uniref:hypothetical protein n=1 Tax=Paraburkholderia sediminicola TaxID=458836 RepID=UPI0038BB5D3A